MRSFTCEFVDHGSEYDSAVKRRALWIKENRDWDDADILHQAKLDVDDVVEMGMPLSSI